MERTKSRVFHLHQCHPRRQDRVWERSSIPSRGLGRSRMGKSFPILDGRRCLQPQSLSLGLGWRRALGCASAIRPMPTLLPGSQESRLRGRPGAELAESKAFLGKIRRGARPPVGTPALQSDSPPHFPAEHVRRPAMRQSLPRMRRLSRGDCRGRGGRAFHARPSASLSVCRAECKWRFPSRSRVVRRGPWPLWFPFAGRMPTALNDKEQLRTILTIA
jgi:hypothetical protein